MVVFPQKKMKLIINEQIVVTANDDIVGNGLLVMLLNEINDEPQPIANAFVISTCNELTLSYEEFPEGCVVGTRPQSVNH